MRRRLIVLASVCLLWLALSATAAFAQSYPPSDQGSPAVEAAASQEGTAFTGGELALPTAVAGLLLGFGAVCLVVGRRRARVFTGA